MSKLELIPIDETAKWLKYHAWSISDLLARRGTEGVNPLIPRQEYETAGFIQFLLAYPQWMHWIADRIGMDGIRDLGKPAHRTFGIKLENPTHTYWLGGAAGLGRSVLLNAGLIGPDDYVDNLRTFFTFWKTFMEGFRQDGQLTSWDSGYVEQVMDQDVVEKLRKETEPLDAEARRLLDRFNAVSQSQGFIDHYDSRLGLGDTGAYDVGDRLVLVRSAYVNEKAFSWSDRCGDLPFSYTVVLTLDKQKMMDARKSGKLKFFSNYGQTGTLFCDPSDYEGEVIREAAVYMREDDYPLGEPKRIPLNELPGHIQRMEEATLRLYIALAKTPRFEKIIQGAAVYHGSLLLPHLRASGLYEEACETQGFWEMRPEVLELFFQVMGRVMEIIPKLTAGLGYPPVSLP